MNENNPKENIHSFESKETAQQRIEQARELKKQAATGGLRFEAYLTSDLAMWVLDMVEKGIFIDPSEAVFVFMKQAKDIEPYDDIKKELLKRRLEEGEKDIENGRFLTAEEAQARLEKLKEGRTEPAIWHKISQE